MERQKFLVVGTACMAIFWPTPFFKRKIFDRSGFLTDQTLLSASAVPIYGEERGGGVEQEGREKEREGERGGGRGAEGGGRERERERERER